MTLHRTLGLIAAVACLAAQSALAATPGALRVGVAKVDITPTSLKKLNPVGGPGPYGGGGDFIGIHDPLFARALVLDNGVTTVAIVSLDSVEIFDTLPLRQRIQRELGIAADHIMLAASHSHSAPRLRNGDPPYPGAVGLGESAPSGPPTPPIPEMDAHLKVVDDKIVDALRRAKASMQPARMGFGTGRADVNVNSDLYRPGKGWGGGFNPDGVSDKTVSVVKFETLNGDPIAVLFNYAVHSTVTINSWLVSADLAGAASHVVEQRYDDKLVALYTMGAAGDQVPKFSGGSQSTGPQPVRGDASNREGIARAAFPAMEAQGYMLGAEVIRVTRQIQATTTAPRIAAAESQITCPAKTDQPRWQEFKDGATIHFGVILIDRLAITGVSAEVVTNIYWHLKKASPLTDTIMLTDSNGHLGYLVDDASYDRGNGVHQLFSSPLVRGCAENGLVNGLVGLIEQLSDKD
jgi:neutral ceramidase